MISFFIEVEFSFLILPPLSYSSLNKLSNALNDALDALDTIESLATLVEADPAAGRKMSQSLPRDTVSALAGVVSRKKSGDIPKESQSPLIVHQRHAPLQTSMALGRFGIQPPRHYP